MVLGDTRERVIPLATMGFRKSPNCSRSVINWQMASWGEEGGKQRVLAQWHSNGGHVLGCIAPKSLSFELWTQSDKDLSRQVQV